MPLPPRTRPPRGVVRVLVAGGAGALLLAGVPGVAAADGGRVLDVGRGGEFATIQAAVDRARSGDTVRIAPGEYREAVCVAGKALTVRGAGVGATTIAWPGWDDPAELPALTPAQRRQPCWAAQQRLDGGGDDSTLADDVSGLFFLDPGGPVRVSGLTTRDHPAGGIVARGADGFLVTGTAASGHDRHGVAAHGSTGVRISGTTVTGRDRGTPSRPDTGAAGIVVAGSAAAAARVSGNAVEGLEVGVLVREARGVRVAGNTLSGNCAGLVVLDDAATGVPGGPDVPAGDVRVTGNFVTGNDRWCPRGPAGDRSLSGVGVQVVDADAVTVAGNVVADNTAGPPPGAPSPGAPAGGLALLSRPAAQVGQGGAGPVEDVRVEGNYFGDNVALVPAGAPSAAGPAAARGAALQMDVVVGDSSFPPLLDPGPGLAFVGNRCDAGLPAGVCGAPYPATP